ncbi:hypothetical protein DICVIV_03645 [Dictyocaulus viviparus]|uniref:G-protein coupled receptors family 1 profile domain-containing protein n=1 Tax=Dictyocaulus viviparus TaxID=29172 RepID=A0A0D8Y6L3_DICVI|nr:hypothetical protein DICVIV_03645 [Dictyocaulus viviparus]
MRLVLFLVAINFLHAISTIPYSIYLTVSWDPVYINMNPYIIIISGAPFIFQLKVDLTLTISLAMERIMVRHCTMIISIFYSLTQLIKIFQALFFPAAFRRMSSSSYPTCCLLLGISLGTIDLILQFSLTSFRYVPNCAALGCFLDPTFLSYWGISNMIMGIVVIILTISIAFKLRVIGQQPQPNGQLGFNENKFKQANRICAGVLIISLMCVTIPSLIVGIIEMIVTSTFSIFGPFYIAGLLCAGTFDGILYVIFNKDMRNSASDVFFRKRALPVTNVSTTKLTA